MKNKFLISAMGVALAGGMSLANADVKLYGQIDLSIDATDEDGGDDDINYGTNQSAFGIKGSEDLGSGMSAFFKLEYQTNPVNDQGGAALTGRDQYLGLGHKSFGKVTFGTLSTAYKSTGKQIDAFYRTSLQGRGIGLQSNLHSGKGEQGQGRGTNMIRYDSPKFSGFGAIATYQLDSNDNTDAATCTTPGAGFNPAANQCDDDNPYSVGVHYTGNGLYVGAAYIDTNQGGDTAAAELVARYKWNDLQFHGIYELDKGLITAQRSGRVGSSKSDGADVWSLGTSYTIGNNLIALDYGQGDESDGVSGNGLLEEYTVWRLAAYHKFSKRTRVYAGYANTDFDDSGESEIFSLGMRHSF